jgi:hypothetical protein
MVVATRVEKEIKEAFENIATLHSRPVSKELRALMIQAIQAEDPAFTPPEKSHRTITAR